ncbi:hypothetical protein NLG07_11815 [Alteromonas sp. LMIT006]|jgi:hypothetical protein|uniref:hypothetical protein n=1 Tax=Alteromonadaceae TaxID=72275 RepID=UPI0020CA5970|nr:hypothetical protein [Alteromonas sp. LMIT006]UTP72649.1 hypothetical protein NLG07_11815 [Alteromonas sp. LMIT006]
MPSLSPKPSIFLLFGAITIVSASSQAADFTLIEQENQSYLVKCHNQVEAHIAFEFSEESQMYDMCVLRHYQQLPNGVDVVEVNHCVSHSSNDLNDVAKQLCDPYQAVTLEGDDNEG